MKRVCIGTLLLVLTTSAAIGFWWLNRRPTLVELQKQIVFANTEKEKARVIDRLENYYLTLTVPAHIRKAVEDQVNNVLKQPTLDSKDCQAGTGANSNVYALEDALKCVLRKGMIARAKDKLPLFQEQMKRANQLATQISSIMHSSYWPTFVERVVRFQKFQAIDWLRAEAAEKLCRENNDKSESWRDAEYYGSLGMRLALGGHDTRKKMDIVHILQSTFVKYYGLFDLAIAWTERSQTLAGEIRYDLRTIGSTYMQATAYQYGGRFELALQKLNEIPAMVRRCKEVPFAKWYTINSLLHLAMVYRELGQYERALGVCDEVERMDLTTPQLIHLHDTKGLVNRSLGNYEVAEKQHLRGLELAKSTNDFVNQAAILNNLGQLCFLLTEYQRALDYYEQGEILLGEDGDFEINLLLNKAELTAKMGSWDLAHGNLERASQMTQMRRLPRRKVELLNSLGELRMKLRQDQLALAQFQEALSICEGEGLVRLALQTKINIVRSLISLSRFEEAKKLGLEVSALAQQIDDIERVLDSYALLAAIAAKMEDISQAVAISEQLIREVEKTIERMKDSQWVLGFSQKVYDYMKQAVLYEIKNGRIDFAFLKLEQVKTLWLRRQGASISGATMGARPLDELKTLQSQVLNESNVVIHYLVTEDKLYAFVLGRKALMLLQKPVKMAELKTRVETYRTLIDQTSAILRHYEPKALEENFQKTKVLSRQLYADLLGWPELNSELESINTAYIVADEFLYELPFSTLIQSYGRKTRFLAERISVLNAASAFLALKPASARDFRTQRILISADPNFQGSRDLIQFAKRQFPLTEELIIGKQDLQKADVVERICQSHDVYVFFGHGVADPVYPENSYIELWVRGSTRSPARSFQLSMRELRNAKWPGASLVLLIGCETAGSKVYRGSGIAGLQQTFLNLGAEAVLATLWKIDSAQAAAQVKSFLGEWRRVDDMVIAYGTLQRNSIQDLTNNSYYRSPLSYLWGGYSLAVRTN